MKKTKSTLRFKFTFMELYSGVKYDSEVSAENRQEASRIALDELSKGISKPYLFREVE